jgi:hypothetical protein
MQASKHGVNLTLTGLIMGVERFGQAVFAFLPSLVMPFLGIKLTLNVGLFGFGLAALSFSCLVFSPNGWTYFALAFTIRVIASICASLYNNSSIVIIAGQMTETGASLATSFVSQSYQDLTDDG